MTVGVILICLLTGVIAVVGINRISASIVDKEYSDRAERIAEAVAYTLDPEEVMELKDAVLEIYAGVDEVVPSTEWGSDEWNAYQANYDPIRELSVFQKIQEHLRVYHDIFKVDCIYMTTYKLD
ncbi:MAG: hypothetical protein K6E50_08245 [Lachnospiraceae bacterium]|nr:hypothetical protein [Lachnospiraceae bacterium]